jgi:hypothetical protein
LQDFRLLEALLTSLLPLSPAAAVAFKSLILVH